MRVARNGIVMRNCLKSFMQVTPRKAVKSSLLVSEGRPSNMAMYHCLREQGKVKKCIAILIFLFLVPSISFARQKSPDVAPHGNKQPPLAITQPRCLEGKQDAHIAREIDEVMKFDLNLAGSFKIINGSSKENAGGIRPGEFDFAPWRSIGADFLLKTGYVIDGENCPAGVQAV